MSCSLSLATDGGICGGRAATFPLALGGTRKDYSVGWFQEEPKTHRAEPEGDSVHEDQGRVGLLLEGPRAPWAAHGRSEGA